MAIPKEKPEALYTLISLEEFKSLLGVDDRDDKLSRFCLVTSTLSIEQYCKRKLLRKKYFEQIEFSGDLLIPLREYPVSEVLAVYSINNEQLIVNNKEMIEPEFYRVVPDCGSDYDLSFAIELSLAFKYYRGLSAVKVVYWAGYQQINNEQLTINNERGSEKKRVPDVPADLGAACMELAVWNFNRYKGRRVGMTGNIFGAGKEGEHFEWSMPENVKSLLEPYRRKTL